MERVRGAREANPTELWQLRTLVAARLGVEARVWRLARLSAQVQQVEWAGVGARALWRVQLGLPARELGDLWFVPARWERLVEVLAASLVELDAQCTLSELVATYAPPERASAYRDPEHEPFATAEDATLRLRCEAEQLIERYFAARAPGVPVRCSWQLAPQPGGREPMRRAAYVVRCEGAPVELTAQLLEPADSLAVRLREALTALGEAHGARLEIVAAPSGGWRRFW